MMKKQILLFLLIFLNPLAALTSNATITIKDPNGVVVVNNAQMTCTFQGYTTGVSFDSPTVCGSNTTFPELINRTNVSCTYTFAKNYSVDGNWVANVTFYHTGYENKGVGIDTTGYSPYDTASPPTGQITNDCTGNLTCTSDPQCNNTVNESVSGTIYTINRDGVQADCVGYGGKWYPSVTGGSNYYCCGDDGASDNFYWWSGTTCMYCNAGANYSAATKCSSPSSYCYGYNDAACQSGDQDYCCYNVGCSSTGATGSATNMVGGNCTCTDGLCAWLGSGNGYCMNTSWGGAGCYSGVYCTATGWNFSKLDSPPKNVTTVTAYPAKADPDTQVNISGIVEDYPPVTGNLVLKVYASTATSPVSTPLCTGNSVVVGNYSSCNITASSLGCSPGVCKVKVLAYEVDNDPCGDHKYSFNFTNVSFLYGNRNVSPPILNAPTSDPNVLVGNSFVLNCTAITGNASTGINMSFQFNSTTSGWASITTSGGLTTTETNPAVNVLNATSYAINVTGAQAGTYWVRCQAYNSTYQANSTAQQVTVTPIPPTINVSADSYPNCGGVFYRVSLYDVNSQPINSYFSLKVINPSAITVLTQAALYPNNGTGVYLGSYLLNTSSAVGTWLLKVTESSGVTAGKNFYARSVCGDGQCTSGENCQNCAADCTCYCGDGVCTSGEDCNNCAADCGCTSGRVCCDCGEICGEPSWYICLPPSSCKYSVCCPT